ncbi:Os03g0557101 [Oryza sativa Japonica Group]|uniref:Os03g0557101 protein n=1 Tax=Oryza sativa subsp. japonica TaxID=39947 RepID=A0A0P0VZ97_ORYSJ|nr:Os03g0557101 [Oryza sativa Japonica Group]
MPPSSRVQPGSTLMYTTTLLQGHGRGLKGRRPVTSPPSRVEKTMETSASKLRALSQAVAMGPPSVPPGRPGEEAMQGPRPTLEAGCRHRCGVPCLAPFLPWARKEGRAGMPGRRPLGTMRKRLKIFPAGNKIAERFEAKSEPLECVFSNVMEIEGIRRAVQWQFEARE